MQHRERERWCLSDDTSGHSVGQLFLGTGLTGSTLNAFVKHVSLSDSHEHYCLSGKSSFQTLSWINSLDYVHIRGGETYLLNSPVFRVTLANCSYAQPLVCPPYTTFSRPLNYVVVFPSCNLGMAQTAANVLMVDCGLSYAPRILMTHI